MVVAGVVRAAAYVVGIVAGVVLIAAFLLGVVAGVATFLAVHAVACSVREGYLQRRRPVPAGREPRRHGEHQQQGGAESNDGSKRRAGPTAGLPSFTYSPPLVGQKVTVSGGGGEEEDAATCSVCLDAFELGETVRLLPVCKHTYHAECIDTWVAKHPTCPICRSGTDPTNGR